MNIKLILVLLVAVNSLSLAAETMYVDDKIQVWSRTGPSNQYKVRFKLLPGAKLEVIQKNEETGFAEVKDTAGRVSWIDSKLLSNQPTSHQLLADAKRQIEKLKRDNADKVSTLERRLNELEPLEKINQDLQSKLAKIETELEQSRQKGQVYESGFKSEAFFAGAVVVLGGMLFGWLLTKLGGGKRNSGWN
ncbi:TIGR04211 family SH3 domain-containing protein [Aliikangiella coralliicola]|uniref:TIGR04211 family SH3 domain-containing protein n=1 Tax=Aliikangiella coralliicola TaxID=2592383 RepID=A0A545UDY9_9GAMM|nr:TIGR04211 family SH3 domain-containing protein [Aliikangiella coralliicola]TQV87687.1 TIGR04211 family SH3 domain-containing protein [Aliikangiella coralliicola]